MLMNELKGGITRYSWCQAKLELDWSGECPYPWVVLRPSPVLIARQLQIYMRRLPQRPEDQKTSRAAELGESYTLAGI